MLQITIRPNEIQKADIGYYKSATLQTTDKMKSNALISGTISPDTFKMEIRFINVLTTCVQSFNPMSVLCDKF